MKKLSAFTQYPKSSVLLSITIYATLYSVVYCTTVLLSVENIVLLVHYNYLTVIVIIVIQYNNFTYWDITDKTGDKLINDALL